MPTPQEDVQAIKDDIAKVSAAFKKAKPGGSEQAAYQRRLDGLQDDLLKAELKIPSAQRTAQAHINAQQAQMTKAAKSVKAANTRSINRMAKDLFEQVKKEKENPSPKQPTPNADAMEKRAQEIRQAIQQEAQQATQTIKSTTNKITSPSTNKPSAFKPKSTQEKLADLQYDRLRKQIRSENTPKFGLPDIPKDTATSIVIASLAAIFFLLAGMGTKFSQLWGYAFNAPVSTGGAVDFNTGGAYDYGTGDGHEAWGIPDITHMIDDTEDYGAMLSEENIA